VPLIRDTPALAEELAVELRVLDDVTEVTANAVTAGVLVEFREHRPIESVVAEVTARVESFALRVVRFRKPEESSQSPATDGGRWLRDALLVTAGFAAVSAVSSTLGSIVLWGGAAAAVVSGVRRASRELRAESGGEVAPHPAALLGRRYGGKIARAATASFFMRLFDLSPPFFVGVAVDILASGASTWIAALGITSVGGQLVLVAALVVAGASISSALEYLQSRLWHRLAQQVRSDLTLEAYRHVQTLDLSYVEGKNSGELLNLFMDDVDKIARFFSAGAHEVVQAFSLILIPLVAMIYLPAWVALLVFLPIPLTVISSLWFQKRIARRYDDVRVAADRLALELTTNLNGMVTIKSFTAEERVSRQLAKTSDVYRLRQESANRIVSLFNPAMRLWVILGFDLVLLAIGFFAWKTAMSVGTFSGLVYVSLRMWYPLTRLGVAFDAFTHARAALSRIRALLDAQPSIAGGSESFSATRAGAEVVFEAVTFEYPEAAGVLSEVSFRAAAGETLAIVGPSGAGKTTISKLLLRFYDPEAGSISIDGRDIREFTLESLRGAISLVTQDAYLFDGTIRENIAMADEGATMEDIIAAARVAVAHDFIMAMPDGYETLVGERGVRLSGGERQRVAIARAVLKDAPILVLDEATSAIDSKTESALLDALAAATPGRTKLVIAHRLSTVRHAGEIIVLKDGVVWERGDHESLLAKNGVYAAFWQLQIGAGVENGRV
jgi:ATP-binding cassette, subfamily B, bacterial